MYHFNAIFLYYSDYKCIIASQCTSVRISGSFFIQPITYSKLHGAIIRRQKDRASYI